MKKKGSKQIKADNQQEAFTEEDRKILIEARKTAMRIAFEEGTVAADVLREKFPGIKLLHRKALGSLFKTEDFIQQGFKKSRTPERRGGIIGTYGLTNEASAFIEAQYRRRKIA